MQTETEKKYESEQHGLVISYFGNSVAVEADDGQVFQCHLRRNQELPVVGDRVLWQLAKSNTGTIHKILPRKSLLSRGDGHHIKAIAANVDYIVIVMAPAPIFSEYLVDRYLVAAEILRIKPIIVLNKVDLLTKASEEEALARLQPYQAIQYPVLLSSIFVKEKLAALNAALKDKTSVLVGPSGVGKSSIISALGNQEAIRVQDVSAKGAGKHTTTATRLYHLPQGGNLIDSPGVREFNLWAVQKPDILRGFIEFHAVVGQCKFRDCMHLVEPGCAVQAAIASGKISEQRFKSYCELMQEASENKKSYK